MNNRTPPFPGFSRGVPIVGQRVDPPKGRYFYQVPALIRREGEPLDADSFEVAYPIPMNGAHAKALAVQIQQKLQQVAPERPAPRVILLSPILLGFVPQEAIDAAEAAVNGGDPS